MGHYEVRRDEFTPTTIYTTATGGIEGFNAAHTVAMEFSVRHVGVRFGVFYRGPDAVMGMSRIGVAVDGLWQWRS